MSEKLKEKGYGGGTAATAFVYALGNAIDPKPKNNPRTLHLGFVDGDTWHLIHIKHVKDRDDIKRAMIDRLGEFLGEKAEK